VKDLHTKKILAQGRLENGLYKFPALSNEKMAYVGIKDFSAFHSPISRTTQNKMDIWHHRLGHAVTDVVAQILHSCNVSYEKNKATDCSTICSSCQLAKSHRLPTYLSSSRAFKPLELIHMDIWGPASEKSTSGAKYFILFLDDFSRYTWFYPLHTKDQALPMFQQFKLQVENQFDDSIKCVQSDNGGEFKSFITFLQQAGIVHRFSCPYNSAQNGRVERKHRHVGETGLALLAHASLPMKFWQYAFQSATFLINRMPSKVLNNASPYLTLFQKLPDYKSLRVFGCLCYPFIHPYNNHKLQYRSVQCIFLGYTLRNKGYLCLDYLTGRVYVTPHVVFDETQFPFTTKSPPSQPDDTPSTILPPAIPSLSSDLSHCPVDTPISIHTDSIPTTVDSVSLNESATFPISLSSESVPTNEVTDSSLAPRMITRSMSGITKKKVILNLTAVAEPYTLNQALKDPHWTRAMDQEIAALHHNHTWYLVAKPSDVNIVGCKWVYKLKHKPDGSIDRYKARLVAKGYHQTLGLDYFKTFSPVVKAATICIILTIALSSKWEVRQFDVHNAFLNGELKEQVYMSQPPGYVDTKFPTKVCRLRKALYDLKQAPRAWFQRLSSTLLQWGFSTSRTDSSMFISFGQSTTLIVLIYVDDILITGSSHMQIASLIAKLNSEFALRDLGRLTYFLGIEVSYHDNSIHLSQTKYISDLLHRTEMFDTKPVKTPGAVGQNLSKFDGEPMEDPFGYRSVVGALQYLTITQPDITFAVNKAC
jgi:histone deacetylase 1/2